MAVPRGVLCNKRADYEPNLKLSLLSHSRFLVTRDSTSYCVSLTASYYVSYCVTYCIILRHLLHHTASLTASYCVTYFMILRHLLHDTASLTASYCVSYHIILRHMQTLFLYVLLLRWFFSWNYEDRKIQILYMWQPFCPMVYLHIMDILDTHIKFVFVSLLVNCDDVVTVIYLPVSSRCNLLRIILVNVLSVSIK